jgi:hypothetical protein
MNPERIIEYALEQEAVPEPDAGGLSGGPQRP